MKGRIRYDMPATVICRQDNLFIRDINIRDFFLLLLCVLIIGSSKADAVPRIADRNLFEIPDVSQNGQVISDKRQVLVTTRTESVNPSKGGRRRYQTLQQQIGPPKESQNLLHPSMLRLFDYKRVFDATPVDNNRVHMRRILSSEEAGEVEKERSHEHGSEQGHGREHERVPEHAPEREHEEGGTADTVDESAEEGEEEEDDDDEGEGEGEGEDEEEGNEEGRERGDESHIEDVGLESHNVEDRENLSLHGEKTSFDSVSQGYHTVRPKLQSKEEIASKLRTAADEPLGIKSRNDSAGQDASNKKPVEQIPTSENSNKDLKPASKNGVVFRGVPGGSVKGVNITHISYMVYKIVKKYDIKTVLDIPCRNNLNWFPELLFQIDFEVIGFRYICVDEGAEWDENLHSRFAEAGSPEFLSIPPTKSHELPRTDLVFSYDGPQQWGVRKTWSFFTGLRRVRPKYIVVTNNPGQMNDDVEHTLNLRKQPFHFSQAMRVISNVATHGKPKQLVFYETDSIRDGF